MTGPARTSVLFHAKNVEGVSAPAGDPPPVLPVDDFELRPLRLGDEDDWSVCLADPNVQRHTSLPEMDLAAVRAAVERCVAGYSSRTSCRWALARHDGRLVGTCGFSNWSLPHAHAELVYDLAPAYWGRGLMRRAVEAVLGWAYLTAGFHRVHAYVMTSNERSIALLERCHFTREGTLRHFRFARGEPRDFHVYARLRDDPEA